MTDARRDSIIESVRHGELTPAAAEAEAARLGIEPLAETPDPARFDPMQEWNWSLPMAVAWVTWRTPDAVRKWWDAYRNECRDWHFKRWQGAPGGPVHEGYWLEQRSTATVTGMRTLTIVKEELDSDLQPLIPVNEALTRLQFALGQSVLDAEGVDAATRGRRTIPAGLWPHLKPIQEHGRDVLVSSDSVRTRDVQFEYVTIPRDALVRLWPAFVGGSTDQLPTPVMSHGGGYLPLFSAAHWIASEGGTRFVSLADHGKWEKALSELLIAVPSENIETVGTRDGVRELVPAHQFTGIGAYLAFGPTAPTDLSTATEPYLLMRPHQYERVLPQGTGDTLEAPGSTLWTRLMVRSQDVAQLWPFGETLRVGARDSGAPGRPTSMHLVELELERRITNAETEPRVTHEAEALVRWLQETHPSAPQLKPKSIRNKIGERFRAAQLAQK
jgi:hypothetical protein